MNNLEKDMSQIDSSKVMHDNDTADLNLDIKEREQTESITCEDANESALLNSIVEAVMRGDMNQVVSLALSHRNTDTKDKTFLDEELSVAFCNKLTCDQNKVTDIETDINSEAKAIFNIEDDVTAIEVSELCDSQKDSSANLLTSNSIYSTTLKSDDSSDIPCSYYMDSNSIIESSNNITYGQTGFHNPNLDLENLSENHLNGNFGNYQTTSLHNLENINSSQQSVQVQLPGIGNFLLQIPSNLKPGEPITLPINLPLTPLSQTSGNNPISINMNAGQLISNQLLSLYHPSSLMTNMNIGKKMRAIAPKPAYHQSVIAPKTNSPNSAFNHECSSNVNSTPLQAPSGPGRRKGAKGKKAGRKRGAQSKSHKNSSYASSTHSIDSQDGTQFTETNNTHKSNCNNFRNTYQCNYYVNSDSSDYINQSHVVSQSYGELRNSNLIDTSDSGEKDLLSLAWEISNSDLGNNDDFSTTYQLYDANNISSEGFVSSEILDQILQNIQKEDISELSICSSNQTNADQRISYSSSFTTLPPCSTVLPSVTTSNYLNNSSNNQDNIELSQCIEIAEVVNLNTEDMLSELEKEESALLDKFVAQYSSNTSESLKCDTQLYTALNLTSSTEIIDDNNSKYTFLENNDDTSEKDLDPNLKESNELSEIAKQIEKDCDELNLCSSSNSKHNLSRCDYQYQSQIDNFHQLNENVLIDSHGVYNLPNSSSFYRNVTTPIDFIYSTSTDSLNSTIVNAQSCYIMPVTIDSKKHVESTFYITDGSLQSKTLDDFGLFDFCTDSVVHQNSDVTCVDDKKYLEPPILEDVSDATPIPSEDESEDDDIDILAFKLSTRNHLTLFSSNLYHTKMHNNEDLWYNTDGNDLSNFLDITQFNQHSCSTDKWYIYDTFIEASDSLHYSESEIKSEKDEIMFASDKEETDKLLQSHIQPTKGRKQKQIYGNSNQIILESCDFMERQNRLRRPLRKLAIYHSIKLIDKEHSTENDDELHSCKNLNVENSYKDTYKAANHCTRSKGSISKSYDAFYEALKKSNKQQHSKIRTTTNQLRHKRKFNSAFEKNNSDFIDMEHKRLLTDYIKNDNAENINVKNVIQDNHIELESLNRLNELKEVRMAPDATVVLGKKYFNFKRKNSFKIPRKYNLRKVHIHLEFNRTKNSCSRTGDKLKYLKKNIIAYRKNKIILNESNYITDNGNIADILEINNDGDFLINNNLIVEQRMTPIESNSHHLYTATVDIKYPSSCKICKFSANDNVEYSKSDKSDDVSRKTFPVRKINRKLRILSGLECDKNIYCSTVLEFGNFDYLSEYVINIQINKAYVFFSSLELYSKCKLLKNVELEVEYKYQNFEITDDDFDDGDSCDARLVIVENEEILNRTLISDCKTVDNDVHLEINKRTKAIEFKADDSPKRYSLRKKSREIAPVISDNLHGSPVFPARTCLKRHPLKRSCKRIESHQQDIVSGIICAPDSISYNKLSLKTPVCAIEKLTNEDLIANLGKDFVSLDKMNSLINEGSIPLIMNDDCDHDINYMKLKNNDENEKLDFVDRKNIKINDEIRLKILKRINKNKSVLNMYKNRSKCISRMEGKHIVKHGSRHSDRFESDILKEKTIIDDHLSLMENGIEENDAEAENNSQNSDEFDNESVVADDMVNDKLCTFVDSNNMETFSRSYGSFSLKIKFQKQDPIEPPQNKAQVRKHKRGSKRRKRLRRFLSSIIGSNDFCINQSNSDYESGNEDHKPFKKHNIRKRKHLNILNGSVDSGNQENIHQNDDIPPNLTPESAVTDDYERQQPIKIKLFKTAGDDFPKSEEMIFSLHKSNPDDETDYDKSFIPKMLQVFKDQPSKPCRQAANLAKKKIFSTAKEDRRSQNATLTSIWNPRKVNNMLNKLPSDFVNSCNDRGKRPRGRPPKSIPTLLFPEKQTSSTGTLKLKIRLSKNFTNCNDDNLSLNGDISGRTSTNDSSILNSAVAGINGPSDALSLESNNFINGITQQLDDSIEYFEAKEAKVYFDPHQVDIEKIKNSYYSSKKNSIHFDNESEQNLYDDSVTELCNKKIDVLSINQDFSQYIDNESGASHRNNLSKDFSSNNKISYLPKDLINISENCYSSMSTNREPQDLSQTNQSCSFDNQISSPNQPERWQSTKSNSSELHSPCRNGINSWFSDHRSFPNSNSILYDSYIASNLKELKNCTSQSQNPSFVQCENESPDSKPIQRSPFKRSSSKEARKSSNNSFDSHSQLSPNYSRSGLGAVPPQLNIHPWSSERNHNASLNHTAAAWMTYAQQQAAAAYMDPQMKAYYNLALSQSMLNNPYCGSYANTAGNPENFYSSLHSQYLNNSKDLNEKNNNITNVIRNHNGPMGTFMEAAQMSSWEHFYSAAAMAGYHNSSQGTMDDYTGFF